MNKLTKRLFLTLSMMTLVACSAVVSKNPFATEVEKPAKVLTAKGYSRLQKLTYLTDIQNRFAIEQAATVNAYRELAKQVYQQSLGDDLLVADQVIKQEPFRVYLDLFLREAKVVESKFIADQKIVVLALTLTPRFYQCISTTVAKVSKCLLEDDKVQFTRIGYQQAPVQTVNLTCTDCATQLSVSGFSNQKNSLDKAMLSVGLYDSEWLGNMAAATVIRYWFLTQIFN